jgi:large subunit ribosomal protein L15
VRLNDIRSPRSNKSRKRVGRGDGSGHGTTSGRGTKGQLSRSGGNTRPGFEGGQMPLQRRVPHLKGFKNNKKIIFNVINTGMLSAFKEGSTVDHDALMEKSLIMKKERPLKVLGKGELNIKLTVKANGFSKTAREKIEKAGGKAEVV